jgi:predicted dehydrogenase/aryl-alcohol dehydrogenase-like predicted oxidoreductase
MEHVQSGIATAFNSDKLAWGILGTGEIARTFAKGLAGSRTGRLVAVGSRSRESAERFGERFNVPKRHTSYEALLADADVRAVYISTPHPMHAEWAIRAAEAGKHILCEKPIGVNYAEAMAIVEAARRHDVFLMEAFMYRCHPQTCRFVELIREGAIGEVRLVQTTFSFHWPIPYNPESRLLAHALGGGGILDVGCYPASMARLIAGAATGRDFADPIEVTGSAHLGQTGVDEWAVASLKFPGGVLAQLTTGVQVNAENVVRAFGSEGWLLVPEPWIPAREGGVTKIIVHRRGEKEPREVAIETPQPLYSIEADTVAANIDRRQAPSPAMSWADTLGNMKTLDLWRKAAGLTYEFEKLPNLKQPISGRPLRVRERPDVQMRYGHIAGVDKHVSRLGVGTDFAAPFPRDAMVIFDEYFERGGNFFDTAYVYGGATKSDATLGHWLRTRGVRDRVVILGKGAHTPHCNPKALTEQLHATLSALGTDHLDLYMLHRDDPAVPAGEFVDVLNEHLRAGRVRAFGGSNWTTQRVQGANDYARRKGLTGFVALSNQFSLARMEQPLWPGCLSASTPADRAWLAQTQTALVPWSSQARGFFTDRAAPDRNDDPDLVRCWYGDENFRRKARAEDLAKRRGVEPVQVALAYVLCQPFPTFPIIGPRSIDELRSSVKALEVELSEGDVRWLDSGE